VRLSVALLLLPACGLLPNERDIPSPRADGFGPFRDRGPVEICEGAVRLVPPEEGRADGAGLCVPDDAPAAAPCGNSAACGARETCVCGRCTVPRCRTGTDCPRGSSCDLATGLCAVICFADDDCPGGVCEPDGCRVPCGSDVDCARGEVCQRSTGLCLVQRCDAGLACAEGRSCDRVERVADLREPEAVALGGRVELYLEERTGGARVILRAVSGDGQTFRLDPEGAVLADAGAPTILPADDVHVLYFERADGSIGRAEGDGASFEADGEPVVAVGGSPSAARVADGVVLAYEAGESIAFARSVDGRTFEPVAGAVDASAFEDDALFRLARDLRSPEIVAERTALGEERILLYADALGVETSDLVLGEKQQAAPRTRSVVAAAAAADQDLRFEAFPFGPVFARVVNVTDYLDEGAPSVVRRGAQVWLYYVGDDTEGPSVAVQDAAGP